MSEPRLPARRDALVMPGDTWGVLSDTPAACVAPHHFAGSGATLAVSARLGRRVIGIAFSGGDRELIHRRGAPTLTSGEAA